jgi:hypothetical protein
VTTLARAGRDALGVAGIVLAVALPGGEPGGSRREQGPMPRQTIADVLAEHNDRLLSVPDVVGVAEGRCGGRPCIKVFVKTKTDGILRKIPSSIGGYPVSIEDTGEFRAHDR